MEMAGEPKRSDYDPDPDESNTDVNLDDIMELVDDGEDQEDQEEGEQEDGPNAPGKQVNGGDHSSEEAVVVVPHLPVSLSSNRVPEDTVELSDDPLAWKDADPPEVPRYEPYKLGIILNLNTLPFLADIDSQQEVLSLIEDYAERLNGYRQIAQGRSQVIMQRAAAERELRQLKREFYQKKTKIELEVAAATDAKGKKIHTNETARQAAVMTEIQRNGEVKAMDERIFQLELDVAGYKAREDALRIEMRPLENELAASRDALRYMIESGVIATTHLEELEDQEDL